MTDIFAALSGSATGLRIFFGLLLAVVIGAAVYFIRHRERIFSGRGADPGVDSPAAGNLRMWMVILVLLHAAVLLIVTMVEL